MAPNDPAARQRADQAAADTALARQLARRFGTSWARMRAELDRLTREIHAARARGETIDEAWLRSRGIVDRLRLRTAAELRVYLDFVRRRVDAEILARAAQGTADANELVRSSVPPGATISPGSLPVAETAEIIAATRVGTPLAALLAELGQVGARRVTEALIEGVAVGKGTREIARDIRGAFAGNHTRALRVARTETIGAYRRATLARFQANAEFVDGWIWLARLDTTVCPVCVAMHGTLHTLDEPFATHPNCRCAAVPHIIGTRVRVETGEEWFARQPSLRQRILLGPGKLELYRRGDLPLADLVLDTLSPVWGPGRRERPLRDLPLVA